MERFRDELVRFEKAKAALRETFLAEVRSLLTTEQLGEWPAFERALRRIKIFRESCG